MGGSPYSHLKIIHHQSKLNVLRDGKIPVPAQVQLVISDLCNMDCDFCSYRISSSLSNQLFVGSSQLAATGTNNPQRVIPSDKVKSIVDECALLGVKAIQLTGGGEPTVHPNFFRIVQHILDKGLDLGLVTNGLRLKEHELLELCRADWVRFSIDAGDKDAYSTIRRISESAWYRVWSNIKTLVRLRNYDNLSDLVIGVGFVVTKENYRGIVDCVDACLDAGVDNVRISAMFQSGDDNYFKDIYEPIKDLIGIAKSKETETFKVIDNFGDRYSDLQQHNPDYSLCGYQYFNVYIGGDLNVYRCCILAYNERGIVGNLADSTLKDVLFGPDRGIDTSDFDAHDCPLCMFNGINRNILYAISSNPTHVNFV